MLEPADWRAAAITRRDTAVNAINAEMPTINGAITLLQASNTAWDNATPTQRTTAMLNIFQYFKALANDHIRTLNEDLDSP